MIGKIIRLEDRSRLPMDRFALSIIGNTHGPTVAAECTAAMARNEFAPASVNAVVNAGRWIVRCPSPRCGGSTIVPTACDRYFCTNCLNATHANRWLHVAWPDADELAAIERVLMQRPVPATRNWDPPETVAVLEAQNLAAGDPLGRDA